MVFVKASASIRGKELAQAVVRTEGTTHDFRRRMTAFVMSVLGCKQPFVFPKILVFEWLLSVKADAQNYHFLQIHLERPVSARKRTLEC